MNPVGLIMIAAGVFTVCGAGFDWDWYMNSRKAALFVSIFGRNGARIFYGLLGAFLITLGIMFLLGFIQDK